MITFLLGSMRAHKVFSAHQFPHATQKDFGWVLDYDQYAGPFNAQTFDPRTLGDLVGILDACPPNAYVVNGEAISPTIPYRRTKAHGLEPASLREVPCNVIAIDYDGTAETMPTDIGEAGATVRSRLPEPWCFMPCVAQATGSAWIKPGLRVRLWFLLDAPAELEPIRTTLKNVPNVDDSTLWPHQPVYVARPQGDLVPNLPRFAVLPATDRPSTYTPPAQSIFDLNAATTPAGGQDWCAFLVHEHKQGRSLHRAFLTIAGTLAGKGLEGPALFAALVTLRDQAGVPKENEALQKIVEDATSWTEPVALPAQAEQVDARAQAKLLSRMHREIRANPTGWLEIATAYIGKVANESLVAAVDKALRGQATVEAIPASTIAERLSAAPQAEKPKEPWQQGLSTNDDGQVLWETRNVLHVLRAHPGIGVWMHAHTRRTFWERCPFDTSRAGREVEDEDDTRLAAWLNTIWPGRMIEGQSVRRWVDAVASENLKDPWADYLRSLRGVVAQESLLPYAAAQIFGACTPLECKIFRWWMMSAVNRAFTPGAKADYMLVLVGDQGLKKSTFTGALTFDQPGLSAEFQPHAINSKDSALKLVGTVFAVMDDLSGLARAEVTQVKNFMTRTEEHERAAYKGRDRRSPRTFVWLGSTNDVECLHDTTGGRRFWFIHCPREIDIAWVRANAAQLWAEAVLAHSTGEAFFPQTTEEHAELAAMQEEHRQQQPLEIVLREVLQEQFTPRTPLPGEFVPQRENLDHQGRIVRLRGMQAQQLVQARGFTAAQTNHLSKYLRMLGWHSRRSNTGMVWTAPDIDQRGTYPTPAEQLAARKGVN